MIYGDLQSSHQLNRIIFDDLTDLLSPNPTLKIEILNPQFINFLINFRSDNPLLATILPLLPELPK